jgi:methionyl-tRNA formyltransferase
MRRVRSSLGPRSVVLGRPDLAHDGVFHAVESAGCDAIASWFWPFKIPERVLALAPDRAFGVHPSLLPRWRGPDPYFWAIARGDRETGVTVHRLAPEYDTGEILGSETVAIEPWMTGGSLAHELDRRSLVHLVETATRLARGERLEGRAQEGEPSWAPQPSDDDLVLRFEAPAAELERRVRAARPSSYTTALLEETFVEVLAAEVAVAPAALAIGEAAIDAEGVVVKAGEGGLRLRAVRVDEERVLRGAEVAALLGHMS